MGRRPRHNAIPPWNYDIKAQSVGSLGITLGTKKSSRVPSAEATARHGYADYLREAHLKAIVWRGNWPEVMAGLRQMWSDRSRLGAGAAGCLA